MMRSITVYCTELQNELELLATNGVCATDLRKRLVQLMIDKRMRIPIPGYLHQ